MIKISSTAASVLALVAIGAISLALLALTDPYAAGIVATNLIIGALFAAAFAVAVIGN